MIKNVYVSDELESELKKWHAFFNTLSKEHTNYEIKQGNPTASKICAEILSIVRNNLKDFDFKFHDDERFHKKLNINGKLSCDFDVQVSLDKIHGVKKNAISFFE
jgi:hypothetical protein